MAVTKDDFEKIWASTSPLKPYSFSKSHYKEGWNFIGGTPPARQMWDSIQKQNDEKSKFLLDKFGEYLPLSGGTLTGVVNGVTPPAGDNSKKIANTEFIQALANILVPTGCVQAYAGNTTPQGWLLCDGSAVSRTTYAALFAVIGTTYGSGDGSTTFALPNLIDKFVEGSATAGTVKSAGLPNITGDMGFTIANMKPAGAFGFKTGQECPVVNGSTGNYNANIDASRSSAIYGKSSTVQPPALTMRYIIKY